ncbi:hypothetical protein V8F20_012769 [Naviculisporaceae sp. PSN 640]
MEAINVPNVPRNLTFSTITQNLTQNCQTAPDYLVKLLKIDGLTQKVWDHDATVNDLSSSYPYTELIKLARSLSPVPLANVSRAAIVDWVEQLDEKLPTLWLQKFLGINFDGYWSDIECHKEVCQKLQREGNADLVGIGMVGSYMVELALATGFVLGFMFLASAAALQTTPGHQSHLLIDPGDYPYTRFSNALQTSVGVFWDSAILFSIAIIAAGLTVVWHNSSSYYTMFFASLSSNLATSVVVAVWPLYLLNRRHVTLRWLVLSGVCTGNAIIAASYLMIGPDSETRRRDIHLSYEWTCLSMGVHHGVEFWPNTVLIAPALVASLIPVILVIWYFIVALTIIVTKVRRLTTPSLESPVFKATSIAILYILPGICVAMFTLMWVSITFMVKHRNVVAQVAGPSLQEGDWSFGQILALATWLPTVVDFAVLWKGMSICG